MIGQARQTKSVLRRLIRNPSARNYFTALLALHLASIGPLLLIRDAHDALVRHAQAFTDSFVA
jgi:hypothetical protein